MSEWDKYLEYIEKHFRLLIDGDRRIGTIPIKWDKQNYPIKFLTVTKKAYEDELKQSLKMHLAEKLKGIWKLIPNSKK